MRTLKSENTICASCMKEHVIDIIETQEQITFKSVRVSFNAIYEYCLNTDEYLETEEMIRANSLAVKDAYRKEVAKVKQNLILYDVL